MERGCLLWGKGGQAVDPFPGGFALARNGAFELKDLSDLGPERGEVVV